MAGHAEVGPLGSAQSCISAIAISTTGSNRTGKALAVVSKVLGHADLATTADLYGHLTPKMTRRASERMGAILAV